MNMKTDSENQKELFVERIIKKCAKNTLLVMMSIAVFFVIGIYSLINVKLDAIPDLSDVQVIVFTEWLGRDPQIVEDQVTYPLTNALLGLLFDADRDSGYQECDPHRLEPPEDR